MESHLVRIINRLEAMAKDGGNLKRNFEREGVVVEVAQSRRRKMAQSLPFVMSKLETYTFDSIDWFNGDLRTSLLIQNKLGLHLHA